MSLNNIKYLAKLNLIVVRGISSYKASLYMILMKLKY